MTAKCTQIPFRAIKSLEAASSARREAEAVHVGLPHIDMASMPIHVRARVCVGRWIIYTTTFLLRLSCHRRESGKSSHAIRAIYGDDRTTIVKRLEARRLGDSLLLHLISHDAARCSDKKIGPRMHTMQRPSPGIVPIQLRDVASLSVTQSQGTIEGNLGVEYSRFRTEMRGGTERERERERQRERVGGGGGGESTEETT